MSVIKIKYHDETRRAAFDHAPVFTELQAAATQFWPTLASTPFKLTYVDPEGDKITLGSDAELVEAVQFAKTAGNPLRIVVLEKKAKESASSPSPNPFAGLPFNAESLQAFLAQLPGLAASTGNTLPDLSALFASLGLNNSSTSSSSSSSGAQQPPSEAFAAFLPLLQQLLATPWIQALLAQVQATQQPSAAPASAPSAPSEPVHPHVHPLFGGRSGWGGRGFGGRGGCGRGGWRGPYGPWGSPAGPFPCSVPDGPGCSSSASSSSSSSNNNNSNEPARHEGIVCDGCNTTPIVGDRFKCTVCPDFDLCSSCEAKKVHDQAHPLVKFSLPRQPFCGGAFHGPWSRQPGFRHPRFHHHMFHGGEEANPAENQEGQEPAPEEESAEGFRHPRFHHHHSRRWGGPFFGGGDANTHQPTPKHWAKKEKKYLARFVQDTTIPDGVTMLSGTKFVKMWRLKNEASIPWPEGAVLAFVGGDQLGAAPSVPLPVAKEGEEIDVAVDMIAPERAGRYTSFWRPMTHDGVKFGQRVWVDFFVAPDTPASAPVPVAPIQAVPSAPAAMEVTPPSPIPVVAPVISNLYPAVSPVPSPSAEPSADELRALSVLKEMGFQGDLLAVLRKHKGQLLPAIRELCA